VRAGGALGAMGSTRDTLGARLPKCRHLSREEMDKTAEPCKELVFYSDPFDPCKEMDLFGDPCKEVDFHSHPCKELDFHSDPCKEVDLYSDPCKEVDLDSDPCKEVDLYSDPSKEVDLYSDPCKEVDLDSDPCKEVDLFSDPPDLSLSGCGFLGIYHVGAVACLQRYHCHS